jgi:TRAP-type C4-dicarboxylate transport system permease small subunit
MELLRKINEKVNDLFILLGGIALVAMMTIACVNMVLRLMGAPMSAAFEIVGWLGALTVSLPLGYTQLKKSHIAVDIVSQKFPPGVRKVVVGLSLLLGTGFFFVAAWQVGAYANTLRVSGEVSETLRVAFYPFTYGVSAGCALITFCLVVDFLDLLFPPREGVK